MRTIMREIIAVSDRQSSSTSFLIRLERDDLEWKSLEGFELALDKADVGVSRYIARPEGYEPHLTALFQRTLLPGMTVVDVGANVGYYSLLSAALVGPSGKVFAFEPNSENARLILMSRDRNNATQLVLHPVALSDENRYAFFSPHMGSNGGILPTSQEVIESRQCVVVPTARLDEIVTQEVDLIKIDVEGAEGRVLAGADKLLERRRPIITIEFSPEMLSRVSEVDPLELLTRICARGYDLAMLDRSGGGDEELSISDPQAFMADYGSQIRIEDLVFRPKAP